VAHASAEEKMSETILREIEAGILSALLKSGDVARDLMKGGFRPDHLPSAEGRDLARMILRVRDMRGDVSEVVEEQIREVGALGHEAARLLDLARNAPSPTAGMVLAVLAAFDLSEATERLRAHGAIIDRALKDQPAAKRKPAPPDRAALPAPDPKRRVHLPDPGDRLPGEPPHPRNCGGE
jgi:hypothetical protein